MTDRIDALMRTNAAAGTERSANRTVKAPGTLCRALSQVTKTLFMICQNAISPNLKQALNTVHAADAFPRELAAT